MFFARLRRRNAIERDRAHALNLRAGLIAAEIRNTMRSKATDRAWTAHDFFVSDADEVPDKQVVKAQHAALRAGLVQLAAQRRMEE